MTSRAPKTTYTQPALRERLRKKIMAGSKGGRPGEWSARKSQFLAHAYEKAGGAYRGGKKSAQKHLEKWTEEKWQTRTGKTRARHGKTTDRYLPKKAWKRLSDSEAKATDQKKQTASRKGRQFVANTAAAKRARRKVVK